jgi:hypothetical protein
MSTQSTLKALGTIEAALSVWRSEALASAEDVAAMIETPTARTAG